MSLRTASDAVHELTPASLRTERTTHPLKEKMARARMPKNKAASLKRDDVLGTLITHAKTMGTSTQTDGFTNAIEAVASAEKTRHALLRENASNELITRREPISTSFEAVRSYATTIGTRESAAQSIKDEKAPTLREMKAVRQHQERRLRTKKGMRHVQVESPKSRCAR